MLNHKFIKNQWLEYYDQLSEITIHFARKQNQLYPALESKGFDKPSKVMWTLENKIKDSISQAKSYLDTDENEAFLNLQKEILELVEDMMVKEEEILYPTALEMLSEKDFIKMRQGDDEIGYCLIDAPPTYKQKEEKIAEGFSNEDLLKDLAGVLQKHGVFNQSDGQQVLDVSQGKLTLDQINLIFKHLQVDLSFVDENEIVKFYSDTKHRVFPRSPGVIGRKVQNCHPKESVETVEEIIRAFRKGQQDQAEFWLEINGKFIYIIYTAVRDGGGNFKGVLEMMQDVTHIRKLTGSQRLLSWQDKGEKTEVVEENIENVYGLSKNTLLRDLVKNYPYIKDFLVHLSPKFEKLKNPILFKTMSHMATLEMVSERGGFQLQELIDKLTEEISSRKS